MCETQNFGKTAELLNASQSSITGRIKKLEDEFGVELFKRGKFGAILTQQGEMFRMHAIVILDNWHKAHLDISLPSQYKKSLNVSVQFTMRTSDWSDILTTLSNNLDSTAFYVEFDYATAISKGLSDRKIDVAIIYRPDWLPKDMNIINLGVEEFVLVSADSCTSIVDIDFKQHIFVNWCNGFKRNYNEFSANFSQSHISVGSAEVAIDYILNNRGSVYVPRRYLTLDKFKDLTQISDAPVLTHDIIAIRPKNHMAVYECDKVINILRGFFTT